MKEANVQASIMMALSADGHTAFRNNVGALPDRSGRLLRYGVGGNGGSDIIGICSDGKFLAVEVKTAKGKPTANQLNFINAVKLKGGRAGVARSAQEAINIARG